VDVYIDGAAALPAIVDAIRAAGSFVHVAGWTIDPDFAIEREPALVTVRDLLATAARRVEVRALAWAGAPAPVMHPTRADAARSMSALVRGTRIHGALDKRNRPMHCHHEKLVIVDGTVAFVGGIDLTDTRGQLGVLQEADRHHRLLAGTVGPPHRNQPAVYVPAKVCVVDDAWLSVGSANLNEHSLFNDTEVNLVTDDATLARHVRERLWSEHLGEDCADRDPIEVVENVWRPALMASPLHTRPLRPLPAISRRSARLKGPLKGLLVDG